MAAARFSEDPALASDIESSEYDELQTPHDKAAQLRRTRNAQFKAFLTKHADALPSEIANDSPPDKPFNELSTAYLIDRRDFAGSILDPREYQIELFERARSRNTIAVLDTGSGKTLIAVLLLKHTFQDELADRAHGKPPRVSFFLTDSVPLVFQQAAVLRNNLDQNVSHLYGAMGTDLWGQQTWDEYLDKNMVIVCTAQILSQCLLNAFVKMDQINLLIFDEAHHTKKDHPYARIIRESYLTVDPSKRPRIFGMTASPIDAKGDIVEAAMQLETLLDSQIATTSNLMALRQFVSRPAEREWPYNKLEPPFATELCGMLSAQFGDVAALERVFRFAWNASSELGRWCADRVWAEAMAEDVLPKLEAKIGRESDSDSHVTQNVSNDIRRIHEASEIVKRHMADHPLQFGELSPKVQLLCEKLREHFKESPETKCIVFTRQRNTAKALLQVCEQLNISNLHPGVLVGSRNGEVVGMNTTFHQQILTLVKFRQGEINCLFSTSVAEEGLDIPDCNLVVRFDLYYTLIQYVQSRGRARHVDSVYASMVEIGNEDHMRRLQEVRQMEDEMRNFCEALPGDRLVHGYDHDLPTVLKKEDGKRTYTIPSSGAKLTYGHAVDVLARYASSLQYENDLSAQVSYVVTGERDKFTCEVILPEKSPIRGLVGAPASRKSMAKQSSAFDACLLLRKHNLLDDHFRSIYHKRLPAMRNARLAIKSTKTNQYARLCKPSFWDRGQGTYPTLLYATVISFVPTRTLSRDHGKIVLLTRERLPSFPVFPIFLDNDIETAVQTNCIPSPFPVAVHELSCLTTFTLCVFRDLFRKTYDRQIEKFAYWLAPAQRELGNVDTPSLSGLIDWAALHYIHEHPELRWSADISPQSLLNRFLYDEWDGRFRYFPVAVDHSLRASDPPPSYVPPKRYMQDILNYSLSLSRNSRTTFLADCDWDQPVLQAEQICPRRNFLDKTSEEERTKTRCIICPQPLMISAIPVPIVASCLAFPAIISRLESYLIVLEGCQALELEIQTEYALEAFTKDSDNTDEHRCLQIHVRRGMGKNYERLEFLGDSFLKMATSISLFCQKPDDDEYDYHVNRMCLICNRNLFNTATQKQLYEYIRSQAFSRHTWYPPSLQIIRGRNPAKHFVTESKHALSEKTIADVCEALIGAALLSGASEHRFDRAVKAVTVFVDNDGHTATSWKDYLSIYRLPTYQTKAPDASELDLAQKIREKLGYVFKYPRLLRSAFTHPSYPSAWAKVPCYQRLEFLGDALLELVCIENLIHRFPDKDPQWLTEHKMAMVSNRFLGALTVKLRLHTHLQYFSSALQSQITHFVEDIEVAEAESDSAMDHWQSTNEPPKCLPDMLEAYLAAIFVDSDFDYTVIEAFFKTHIEPYFTDMSIYDTFANRHPTTYLMNKLTSIYGCNNFCIKSGELPVVDRGPPSILAAVMVHGEFIAEAVMLSSRSAKVVASQKALEVLDGMLRAEFRAKYHCDCGESMNDSVDIGTAV